MERTLELEDIHGNPITALLSLPGEEVGDRTGRRHQSIFLTDTTTIQFYDASSRAKPLGRLLASLAPETLGKVSEQLSLNGTIISLAEATKALRWLHEQERRERAYETTKATPFTALRPSALSERLVAV